MKVWATAVVLVVITVFVLQNTRGVEVSFPEMHDDLPPAIAVLIATIAGSLITLVLGTARITQVRHPGPPAPTAGQLDAAADSLLKLEETTTMWTTAERATTISLTPPPTPRLRLRSTFSMRAPLDGAWWPRSADPVAELPGLILALQDQAAHQPAVPGEHPLLTHVLLAVADWDGRPRRLRIHTGQGPAEGRVVRLSWFATQPAGLLTAIRADGLRVDLLIVPSGTAPAAAHAVMELALQTDIVLSTSDLLATLTFSA